MIALHPPSMTTSLALLPAPHPQTTAPASSNPAAPLSATQRRPKLSLNTAQAQIRTFGKGSSLRLDTLSAVSPTARNTFSNGYEPATTPAADSSPAKPWTGVRQASAGSLDTPNSASTTSTISTYSSSSSGSESARIPYKLLHNVQSILSNSPLPRVQKRSVMASSSRPMFPATKRVSFRNPLSEEIKTTKYTMAHSDIASASSSISTLDLDSTSPSTSADQSTTGTNHIENVSMTTTPTTLPLLSAAHKPTPVPPQSQSQRGEKRDSPSDSESDSDSCPETPVAGRRKRRREWVWTLGPVPGKKNDATSSSSSSSEAVVLSPTSDVSDEGSVASSNASSREGGHAERR